MKNAKTLIAMLLALVMVLALCACGQTAAPVEDNSAAEAPAADTATDDAAAATDGEKVGQTVLKCAFNQTITNPEAVTLQKLSDDLYDATEGRYSIEVYPDAQLGDQAQTLEQQLPWLENVRVRYRLPNTLVVQADPAHPRYALASEDQWATVSSRLKVLQLDSQQPQGLVSLDAGKAAVQVGQQLVLQTDPEPVDEAAILGQEDLSNEEKAAALEKARQEAQTAAQEASNQRMESLRLLLQTLDKWNLSADVTSVTVADDMEMQFGYQGRIQVLVGTSNQLDYKIQFSAEILAHQLSASDRGTLDSSNILSSGELQPVFSRDIS